MPTSGTISQLTIPVLENGTVTNKTYDLPSGGGGSDDNFVGTTTQWNALSIQERAAYKTTDFLDDFDGYPIDNVPTANSDHLVKSGGVYSAIANSNYYLETSVYTTASGLDTFEFTDSKISSNARVDVYANVPLVSPVAINVSGTTLSISFSSSDSVTTCGVYLRA